jgi:sensor histidine kinase regulating citrate/malate metabolism
MNIRIKESNIIVGFLGLFVILLSTAFFFETTLDGVTFISIKNILIGILMAIFLMGLVILIFVRRLFVIAKQEIILESQDTHIANLRELIRIIRTQRHDFVNHLQTIYALYKTGQTEKVQQYIEDLYQDIQLASEMLSCNIPELSALLLVKMGIATVRNISFEVNIESSLNIYNAKPSELNALIGNLVDNAFEAVEKSASKQVKFRLLQTPSRYAFQIWNEGYIENEVLEKMFSPGFSTKKAAGKRGFGLASVKSIAQKYNWDIVVSTCGRFGTKFTVLIPKDGKGLAT